MKEKNQLIFKILELMDTYTKGHSQRVAKYATILAKATNKFSKEELKKFHSSCLLHDIGKMAIPDKILNKSNRLTKDEFNIMKLHPLLGLQVARSISLTQWHEETIRSHHEKWDGTGYPDGLKGEEIPLTARIITIADSFDAMTSYREYQPTLSPREAYRRINEGANTQFDPELIMIFNRVYPQWLDIIQADFT
ncbi:HD domain-containing phosphohydrolase [Bacillus cereus group sp. RP43]|uniref:HD-GYP domain-containing protein n=1 Tax=Bacillus cereus group sp. RP43 TaxID=3040260 RepID=UPI003396CBAD